MIATAGGLPSVTEVRTVVSNVPSSLPAVMVKSDGTVAVPSGVSTCTRPVVAPSGTFTVTDVAVTSPSSPSVPPLKRTTLSVAAGANPEPVSTIRVPGAPDTGSILETTGPEEARANGSEDCALELPTFTETLPSTAPAGTVTTSRVAVAEVTVAALPPKETALSAAVVEKPVPDSVTSAPAAALTGTTDSTESVLEAKRSTPRRLPASS